MNTDTDFTRIVALAERFPKLTDDETDFPALSERLTVMSGNAVLTLLAVEVNDEPCFVVVVNENVVEIPMPDHNEYGAMSGYYRLPDFATGVALLTEALTVGIGLDSAP